MKHKFSKEILYHFNCGKCKKWWSIADYHLVSNNAPKKEETEPNPITCPFCVHTEELMCLHHNSSVKCNPKDDDTMVLVDKGLLEKLKDFDYWKEWKN